MDRNTDRDPQKQLNQKTMNDLAQNSQDGLLVTHVNQTQDLLQLQGSETQTSALEDSEDWLAMHSLKFEKLTLADLISQGTVELEDHNNAAPRVHFTTQTILHFKSRLSDTIERYQQRLRWLSENSKKAFGLIKGSRVGLLIDSSQVSGGPQPEEFQNDLASLIDEQLSHKEKLYVLSFGVTTRLLWPTPVEVSTSTLQKLKLWVKTLQPEGSSNLLQALKKVFAHKELDSLVIVLRSCPDQPSEFLSDFIQQSTLGRSLFIHVTTYKCDDHVPSAVLKNLTDALGGYYHCYSPESELYTSRDVDELLAETRKAQGLLRQVQALCHSSPCEELSCMINEISLELTKGPFTSLLPKPPKHEAPLTIKFPDLDKTSAEWLKINGLKAKKLNLYQVLAPNAFNPVEEFVPILQKTVAATIHEKAMVQFEWHDGTMKNIHVDPPVLFEYQKQLGKAVQIYEKRLQWLSLTSRRIWGTVCQRRVVILLDVSVTNSMYIIHIQHSLRLLLEEQLSNKDYFNIIAFGSTIESWRPEMVAVSHDNLQRAWRWALSLQCQGSRNVLGALRKAIEVDFKDKTKHESQGIYLFTGGVPDQDVHIISAYVAEACGGCDLQLNVCLFYVGEPQMDTTPPACYASRTDTATAYKEVAQAACGRFHWFGETGIYESDDINAIVSEIEKALNYSQKCAFLVASLKNQSGKELKSGAPEKDKTTTLQQNQPKKLYPPKPTAPSVARMSIKDDPDGEASSQLKILKCHPLNGETRVSPAAAQPGKEAMVEQRMKANPRAKAKLFLFYTESGNSVGSVYKRYTQGKSIRRINSSIELPRKDTVCSSQEWTATCRLKRLKLELSKCLGPNCRYQTSVRGPALAKHCTLFPSIEINGVVRHIQWTLWEIETYITCMEKVTKCYVQRLHWLLSGSRRLFGTILESNVCILLDTSGSMGPHLQWMKTELVLLIWEQLRKHCNRFNLLSFAEDLKPWQDTLVKSTEPACHKAMKWVAHLQAQGSTSVLAALTKAFSFQDVQGLYLLTDGKPDTSCSLILDTVQKFQKERGVKVHTISLTSTDRTAMEFLRKLASLSGGRYHCPVSDEALKGIQGLLVRGFIKERDPKLPLFEGDDLKILAEEFTKARNLLKQAQVFRSQLLKKNDMKSKVTSC
ncbi:von Willebrand factor A domain-containing protein 3A [Apodemus sylvaticus]|uniref:von Willebrand factor A domain-containing protein 3A n=1 Tax=Apodemus sylvaticus TaxID=10129 RepID=UPI002242696C|nr:von Willebrand factor A domain-containing protein 3A [Apodemus sylvaticus]